MKNKIKIFKIGIFMLLAAALFVPQGYSAGLAGFRQDFEDTKTTENQKKKETAQTGTSAPANANSEKSAQSNTPVSEASQAQTNQGNLQNFYNDFTTPSTGGSGSTNNSQPSYSYPYYYQYYDYPYDYYRYNNPYYYPYSSYYPQTVYDTPQNAVQVPASTRSVEPPQVMEERHSWFNTTMQSQYVSDTLNSIGVVLSLVSAGRIDQLSYGFKYDYSLFTEKLGADHVSLSISYLGMVIGKQMGNGLVEAYLASAQLENQKGLALKFSTDQFLHKNYFLRGSLGVNIINSSPLTDLSAGAGIANSWAQAFLGYRIQNSVNNALNGPEIKISLVF